MIQNHIDVIISIQKNCLAFYLTAAKEIHKRLPVNNIFLSKLQVFTFSLSLFDSNRKTFNVSFVVKTIDSFDKNALKKKWIAWLLSFTIKAKQNLSKLNFDNKWKKFCNIDI